MKKERNTSYDILRLFAFFCVASIHFFLKTDFYSLAVEGKGMFVLLTVRSFFMICVPLFMIMSGMLMYKKQFCGSYYLGIVKTYLGYILASMACLGYWIIFEDYKYTLRDVILGILNFNIASYSWYVEMYIGLFMIIPLLNLIYNNAGSRKRKLAVVLIFVLLTALPASLNSFNFEVVDWWKRAGLSYISNKILPDWWSYLYPIGFYLLGCYLGEYKPKMGRIKNLIYIAIVTLLFAAFCYFRNYKGAFIWGGWQDHRSLPVAILSVLVVIFITGLDASRLPRWIRAVLARASDCTLIAFLVSCIFDTAFYRVLNTKTLYMADRILYFPVIVPAVVVCSLILGFILNLINKPITAGVLKLIDGAGKLLTYDRKRVADSESISADSDKKPNQSGVSLDENGAEKTESEKLLR